MKQEVKTQWSLEHYLVHNYHLISALSHSLRPSGQSNSLPSCIPKLAAGHTRRKDNPANVDTEQGDETRPAFSFMFTRPVDAAVCRETVNVGRKHVQPRAFSGKPGLSRHRHHPHHNPNHHHDRAQQKLQSSPLSSAVLQPTWKLPKRSRL